MYLKSLNITNFKNYAEIALDFSPNINCFAGNNGVGKTNLLDAIHYLSFCKSYVQSYDMQNIRHNEEFFAIHGTFSKNDQSDDAVSCVQKRGVRKIMRLNKKEYERFSDHIGLFPVVMISPYDSDLINDGSDVRRKFMDVVISQFNKSYLEQLIAYNQALERRNKFLRYEHFDETLCEIYDQKLILHGSEIFELRTDFINRFSTLFQHYFNIISKGSERVGIYYNSQLQGNLTFFEQLKNNRHKDRTLQFTTIGIHKDDLELMIDDFPVKKFGSQGQQKSFTLAMRLAQLEFTKQQNGFFPILLLDDIFDKLDNARILQLLELVGQNDFGQVFITDTDACRLERILNEQNIAFKLFHIAENNIVNHVQSHADSSPD
ncbi:MAG: DNA replication/repair protein RecF [Bacteroidales bacterium]|jgi:DNA replication and repair protein RecF|nr:DNA replication/repair protein RecF [Bacteroidales bacterium]